ncbi:MAG: iron response transcriptional regulator IrrA [Inquilinaceae bacterium]
MSRSHAQSHARDLLRRVALRPTRQRLALARLLFDPRGEDRHVSAEQLHAEAGSAGVSVSLATVYNTLHQLTTAGLLREVVIDSGRSYFDTNVGDHYHFWRDDTGELKDVPQDQVELTRLPLAPPGTEISGVDVIIRLKASGDTDPAS